MAQTFVNRITGERYQVIPQMVDLKFDGHYVLRYNIGIEGYSGWSSIECIYDDGEFNEKYMAVEEWEDSGMLSIDFTVVLPNSYRRAMYTAAMTTEEYQQALSKLERACRLGRIDSYTARVVG